MVHRTRKPVSTARDGETHSPVGDAGVVRADASADSEKALLQAWRDGHEDALGDLLEAFKPRIWSICWRTLHHYEDAADLTQDVMVRIMKGLPGFDGRSKLSTWIIRITLNACLSHIRKQKLRRHASLDAPISTSNEGGGSVSIKDRLASGEPESSSRVQLTEEMQALNRALLVLDEEQRLLLILRDMHGSEYAQLAEIFEVPVGTIKSRLFRARAALCRLIEPPPPESGEHS